MKKFLSLVLALVMTMSLVTISSSAADDYTDTDSIQYNEAVDVISAIGIVSGDTDGSFRPTDTLTRQAAAKIICNLLLGPTTAIELSADTAPYPDVPTTSQFAGYIAYCQKAGIISGYADGTFKPTNTLTGYAFMKMLLGALGYNADTEGYTGANWSVSVAKRALSIGLNNDLNGTFTGTKAVTREEAALYTLNMLQADMVEYENNGTVVVNGTTISSGVSVAKAVTASNSTASANDRNIAGDGKNGYIQFAEQYFSNLVLRTTGDAFGRPSNVWTYKGVEVGTYANSTNASYTGNVKLNKIYEDLGMTDKANSTTIYMNGIEVVTSTSYNVEKSNDNKLGDLVSTQTNVSRNSENKLKVGDGTIVEAFLDTESNDVTISIISVYGGKVTDVKDATSKKDAYVVVETGTNGPVLSAGKTFNDEFETTDFAEDDVVAYTYSVAKNEIKSMYKMESKEGTLSKKTIGKSLQLGSDTYTYSTQYTFNDESLSGEGDLTNSSSYVVYLDENGYALWIEESSFSVDAYALVLAINGGGNVSNTTKNEAKLLFSDGTTKTVDLDKDYTNNNQNLDAAEQVAQNTIIRYKVTDSGSYKLTNVANTDSGDTTIASKILTLDVGDANARTITADSKTVFVVQGNNGSNSFKVYTGIKNAPTIADSGTAYCYLNSESVAKVVFIIGATSVNSSKNVTFVSGRSVSNRVEANDTANYYQYNAVVDGEITTIMVEENTVLGSGGTYTLAAGSKENNASHYGIIFNDTTTDTDDIITAASFNGAGIVTVGEVKGVKKISGSDNEIKLGDATMSLSSSAKIYTIDWSGNITAVTLSDVRTNSDSIAYWTYEDGDITNLFIQLPKE
jgi:hypothetical protein